MADENHDFRLQEVIDGHSLVGKMTAGDPGSGNTPSVTSTTYAASLDLIKEARNMIGRYARVTPVRLTVWRHSL